MAPAAAATLVTPTHSVAAAGWRMARRGPALPAPACVSPAAASHVPQSASASTYVATTSSAGGVGCAAGKCRLAHATPLALGRTLSQAQPPLRSPQPGAPRRRPSTTASPTATTVGALPEFVDALAASPYRDYYVLTGAAIGAVVWVKLFDYLAANGTLEQKLSRKLVHTTTGPIFVVTWALFSANPMARVLAAVVPMLNFMRLFAVGTGLLSDPGLVNSVSRSGDRTELLKGPLFYVVTLVAATVLCWRDNPAGLIAVSMMCGGDGLADIVGRRLGRGNPLPYNTQKSVAGSVAMLVGGYGMAYGLISLFCGLGFFTCYPPATLFGCLGAIAAAATVVESLPINKWVDDNVSVPVVAAALSLVLLPQPVEAAAGVVASAAAAVVPVAAAGVAVAAAAAGSISLSM
ncbi:hypothetical protein HXX76_008967 [Chlamydomonas incerta]|uniref:phytol kinase n=1 Tax=Chlamydomonas incerta TaxID=51695 RepID=A0A835VX64_CHLIN|nr:hypothetical protein HXX76_008967 [Chlamydomonas incerta]|eukprot:KAG2432627.1 hypothetical protein HXX76_008967 [Chlamydomonas incerta]